MSEQTGLVLLHGSELGGWIWQRAVPLLRHPALVVDLPGRDRRSHGYRPATLQEHVDVVVQEVGRWTAADQVVIVAHSASGVLAPAVAAAFGPRAVSVVFLAAMVPEAGKSWIDLQPRPARLLLRALYRARPRGVLSPRAETVRLLCADLDEEATALVLDRRVPEPRGLLADAVPSFALRVPVHMVTAADDRALSAQAQAGNLDRLRELARSGPPVLHEVPGGHLPMLSAPAALAALLDRIADDPGHVPRSPSSGQSGAS